MTVGGQSVADQLVYERDGTGIPFVFLHGLGSSRFRAQDTIAGVDGVEAITVDCPAHGDSSRSSTALDFASFAHAIVDVLDRADIGPAVVGGISMGAGIALRIAQDFPERVLSLVLVRPAWADRPGRPHLDIIADIGGWIHADGVDLARERLISDPRFVQIQKIAPLAAESVANTIDGVAATGRPDVLRAMVESWPIDDLTTLDAISQPALVVSTEHDPLHPPHIADQLLAELRNATGALAPPRYLDPGAHRTAVAAAINSFIAHHHR